MSKHLHFTISDFGPCFSSTAGTTTPGVQASGWHDPGKGEALAPPDDPGKGEALAPPDDPAGAVHAGHGASSGSGGCGCRCGCGGRTVARWVPAGCAHEAETAVSATSAAGNDHSGFIIVRLSEEIAADDLPGLLHLAHDPNVSALLAALKIDPTGDPAPEPEAGVRPDPPNAADYLPFRPLIRDRPLRRPAPPNTVRQILRALELRAAGRWPYPGPSLLRYLRIDCRGYPQRIPDLVRQLARLRLVEVAYPEVLATDSAFNLGAMATSFAAGQSYLDAAPVGIGARGARKLLDNQAAAKVRLVDLEQRWVLDHDELVPVEGLPKKPLFGYNRYQSPGDNGNHGTAVLAQLAGSGGSVEGIAAKLTKVDLVSHWDREDRSNGHIAEAIVNALVVRDLGPGDLLLLEVQRGGGPVELYDLADATAMQLATALGVTVIEPAGNGGLDLDAALDFQGRAVLRRDGVDFRESGAVLVGAAWSTLPHDRAPFSSYGSRVDCYGWGDSVLTAGYGDLDPGGYQPPKMYTGSFSGTSSASPCVAGAAVWVQYLYQARCGSALPPQRLRALLADPATGTPQGPNVPGAIGVMPNLEAIFGGSCVTGPQLYLRRSAADDGQVCRNVTCSCPDIFAATQEPNLSSSQLGGLDLNPPAPGISPLPAQGPLLLFARPRNRGQGTAHEVRSRFYTAEVATFIWPEMWQRVPGQGKLAQVPQGDLPVLAGHCDWAAPDRGFQQDQHRAILAILAAAPETEPEDLLPKLSYCFDPGQYLAFLERPTVGCRNIHRISCHADLDCLVTGMPDRARPYELQLIQRLPAGTAPELETTHLLAALLRKSQPWLEGNGNPGTTASATKLRLPSEPCLTFKDVWLPARACHPCTLRLASAQGVQNGHGIVLRQLYRGREIGRVTWYLTGS